MGAPQYAAFEVLCEDADEIVFRGLGLEGEPVLLKALKGAPRSSAQTERLRRELEVTRRAGAEVAALPAELTTIEGRAFLVLHDDGGAPLARRIGRPLDPDAFLALALAAADAVAALHARNIAHLGLHPGAMLVLPDGRFELTGLGSTDVALSAGGSGLRSRPAKMWPYIAPEQTGRLGVLADRRADLYALGVIYFELLTGRLPFEAGDLPAWIHSHCAVSPPSPTTLAPDVPPVLAEIVLRALQKPPEARYQTALSLRRDLARAAESWGRLHRIDAFELGEADGPPPLRVVAAMHGRARETAMLQTAIARSGADGPAPVVLVSGSPGLGKTTLAEHARALAEEAGGISGFGKCDLSDRDVPYAALLRACDGAVACALETTGESIPELRARFEAALGVNAPLLAARLPTLARLFDSVGQPTPIMLFDSERRVAIAVSQLLAALAGPGRPLVLSLDDLQWADSGTLHIVERWGTERPMPHVLLVGTFRPGEPHPELSTAIESLGARGALSALALGALSLDAVRAWIAEIVRGPEGEELSAMVYARSSGNPLEVVQLLAALHQEGFVVYSAKDRSWIVDRAALRAKGRAEDAAELVAASIRALPEPAREGLRWFAALRGHASLETLTAVLDCTEAELLERLDPAFSSRLIARSAGELRFLHDTIQDAAYALTPVAERPDAHLAIARTLLAKEVEPSAERVFELAHQFQLGASRILGERERAEVASLDLLAGRTAQGASDCSTATVWLASGAALLGSEGWSEHSALTFALHLELARCRFVAGEFDAARELAKQLLDRAREPIERGAVHAMLAEIQVLRGEMAPAIDNALAGLSFLGVELPRNPSDAEVDAAYARCEARLAPLRWTDVLESLPASSDVAARATCGLLSALLAPAAYHDWNLVWLTACVGVEVALDRGTTSSAAVLFSAFALGLSHRWRRYRDAFDLGEAAYRFARRDENLAYRARAGFAYAAYLAHPVLPARRCIAILREELGVARSIGDRIVACVLGKHLVDLRLFAGDPLDEIAEDAAAIRTLAESAGFALHGKVMRSAEQLIDSLRGALGAPDDALHRDLEQDALALGRFHDRIDRLRSRFLLGDLEGAAGMIGQAIEASGAAAGFVDLPELHFHAALARASIQAPRPADGADACLAALRPHEEALAALAASCPESYEPRRALVRAEISRLEGDELGAELGYERAITLARAAGFIHVEAMADEVAARFHRARGFHTMADAYLEQARDAYEVWGARGKARSLALDRAREPSRVSARLGWRDARAVLESAKSLGAVVSVEGVHERLIELAIEHVGAQRGAVLVPAGGARWLRAGDPLVLAAVGGERVGELGDDERLAGSDRAPLSLCHAAIRVGRSVVVADARETHRYSADPYFASSAARSVACVPVLTDDGVIALVLLEHDLEAAVFSAARLHVLDALVSQAAISMENARRFSELRAENAELRHAEARLLESEAILDNVPALVSAKDAAGRYVIVNRHFHETIRVAREDVLGRTDFDLFSRAQAEILRSNDAAALLENRAIEVDEPLLLDDGRHEYLALRFPLRDARGEPYAVCGIATDVTARRRAEQELRRSHSLLEATLESTADGILVVDGGGRLVRFNQSFRDMWKIPEDVLASGDDGRAIASVLEQLVDPEGFLAKVRALYDSPTASSSDTLGFRDGRVVERFSRPQRLGDEVVGRVWSFRDVTERVVAARERESLLLDEQRARAGAEDAVRERDEFLSVASHELRTPLASLLFAVQGIEQLAAARCDPQIASVMRVADRQVRRLATLVGLLLDASRARGGELQLERTSVDLSALVRDVVTLLADEAVRAGCVLSVSAEVPVVGNWDSLRIEQVITNLLTNAIKFGRGRAIDIEVAGDGATARLAIRDHGIGIAPELEPHLFQPFKRGVSARHYGGLGLGLYITRTIVEAHGGTVRFETEVGEGSTFIVELPTAAEPGNSAAEPEKQESA